MLQIKHISKQYKTGELVQHALRDVSLNLRDNEFVSILGPSGSGKTTLLNIIGGLDRYDTGDLIINGISTKQYKDRDWDSYRNHTIGFVFQSYHLIPTHSAQIFNFPFAINAFSVFILICSANCSTYFGRFSKKQKILFSCSIQYHLKVNGIVIPFTIVFPNCLANSVIKLVPFI